MWKLLNGDRQPFPDYRFTIVAHLTSNAYLVHTVDSDSQCEGDLVCFQRDSVEAVPGCDGTGSSGWDYCYKPDTLSPTVLSTPIPTNSPTDKPTLKVEEPPTSNSTSNPTNSPPDPPTLNPTSGLPVLTDLDNNLGTAGYDVCEGDCGEFFALFLAIGTSFCAIILHIPLFTFLH